MSQKINEFHKKKKKNWKRKKSNKQTRKEKRKKYTIRKVNCTSTHEYNGTTAWS